MRLIAAAAPLTFQSLRVFLSRCGSPSAVEYMRADISLSLLIEGTLERTAT